MQPLLTASQMKAADLEAVEKYGLPELLLMEHAALALVAALSHRFGALLPTTRGVVLAGVGNNGGDVLAATRLLAEKGCENVFVVLVGSDGTLSHATQQQLALLAHLGIAWGKELSDDLLDKCDWVLDGMLGTGLKRDVEGDFLGSIRSVNRLSGTKWIVSADIPSGLSSDTGNPLPEAVKASATVTLGFYKRGLVTGAAAAHVGQLTLAPIQIPRGVPSQNWDAFLYAEEDASRLPTRPKDSHKGDFGRVGVFAGPPDKEGAAALAALGALRAGAGLVTVFADETTLESLRPRLAAEIMTEQLPATPAPKSTLVVGPGLGTDKAAMERLATCLRHSGPVILDADATTLLAQHGSSLKTLLAQRTEPTVLTPHPKEAAVLLGWTTEKVQADRYQAVRALEKTWGCAVILKGSGSLCTVPGGPIVAVFHGDASLSKGGTGDVLAGITASFLAQGLTVARALPLAAYVHGRAAEILTAKYGHTRSALASEVADSVIDVFKELECRSST